MNAFAHRISRTGEAVFKRFCGNGLCAFALVVALCVGGNVACFSAPAQKTNPAFTVNKAETEAWNTTLDDYVAGTLNTRIPHTVLSEPPPVLARLLVADGCGDDLRIIIHKSILDKTFGKTASKFTGDFHKIALADMRNLLRELADPIAIFDSAHGNGDKVVLTTVKDTETGESVIVAIKINVPGNNAGRVNAVSSIHGRKIGSFHKWLKDDLLRYYHTKKFPQWLVSVGVRNPQASIPRGKKILTEKDFRHTAPATRKRNSKTKKSAFFKNLAPTNAFCGNGFACALSGLGDFTFPSVGRRFALPYATARRAVGALGKLLQSRDGHLRPEFDLRSRGMANLCSVSDVPGFTETLVLAFSENLRRVSTNGAVRSRAVGALGKLLQSRDGRLRPEFDLRSRGMANLCSVSDVPGFTETPVLEFSENLRRVSTNGAVGNSVGQSEATPYVANDQQLSPERA